MNPDSPIHNPADEALEARIVSWVLGEASAFEAAELERLCEERPELLVFRRRMRDLHGLLTDSESAQPDDGWKLPEEKRKVLDEIFGSSQDGTNNGIHDAQKEKRIRHSGRRALLAIAACVVLTLVVLSMVPGTYQAETVLEVKPLSGGTGTETPQYFATEFEKIKSRNSLEAVTKNLDLSSRWGVDQETAIRRLKTIIDAQNIRGTDLISIRAREKDPALAKDIANEVAKGYKNYRASIEAQYAERQLAELNKAIRDQEDKVEERRKVLATITRTKGIVFKGTDSFYGASGVDEDQGGKNESREEAIKRGLDAQDYVDAKREFETDQQLLQQMKLKQMGETISAKIPNPTVIVHDEAVVKVAPLNPLRATVAKLSGVFEKEEPAELAANSVAARQTAQPDGSIAHGRNRQLEISKNLESKPASEVASADPFASPADVGGMLSARKPAAPSTSSSVVQGGNRSGDSAMIDKLKRFDEPIRSNPALTNDPEQNVDKVRRSLYVAEGNFNLGKFDDAKREYENTLRADPGNQAARRGLERVATAKTDYYRASNDHTRAELLSQVDSSWELSVPSESQNSNQSHLESGGNDLVDLFSNGGFTSQPDSGTAMLDGLKANFTGGVQSGYKHESDAVTEKMKVVREFQFPMEYEAPALPSLAADASEFPNTPATPTGWTGKDEALKSEKSSGGVEYEIHTGYTSEYLFRGMDLGKDNKAQAPASLLDLIEEIAAAEDPYSTFSLNVSDASFQIAQAALAKGERPDPAGIKVEQFYNAVDYGDPAPASGEPVAATIEQSAHPVMPGRSLVRVALKTAAAGRGASQPLRLTLLVDQSGSMVREDRRAAMDKALKGLSALLTGKDSINVIGFSRKPRLIADQLQGDKAGQLAELIHQSASEGGTNLDEAIQLADQMSARTLTPGAQNRIVLFTDGAANLGNADPVRLAEKVKALRQKGIAFDIAGIAADDLNDDLLAELARNGNGRYYVVGKGGDDENDFAKQLAGAFRPAAENVKVQVRFNPERVARYKLIGFEKDRLKTEDFRNDAVDAAELAAEEAGVAIYQIETLPEGKGEIGEVSVRFRDTAANDMVERTWTMRHDPNTPAFDRATPSMQLATLTLLAAEKLKGGPLADAIDFQQLAEPRENVKRFYGQSGRIGQVLQMLNALR